MNGLTAFIKILNIHTYYDLYHISLNARTEQLRLLFLRRFVIAKERNITEKLIVKKVQNV